MNYTVETAEKSTVKVTITFSAEEWANANNEAYKQNKDK